MLKPKSEKISAESLPSLIKDSIRIDSGSFVINNTWVSFSGAIFRIRDYISSVVVGNRTRFFKDRGYAVYLLICIDPYEGIVVIEGRHVLFTTLKAIPQPESFNNLPLIGLILIQDNSMDLVYGFKPISNENIVFFSGTGNILDKNLEGVKGENCFISGETGQAGATGIMGVTGIRGIKGITGSPGHVPEAQSGNQGLQGMTGINWDIHVPFDALV